MRLVWYGHSCFLYDFGASKVLVDPFLEGNTYAPVKPKDIEEVDIVLVTHDHSDHLGDAIEILKRTGASSTGVFELMNMFQERGVKNVIPANVGGRIRIGDVTVSIVPAIHTCSVGTPVGYVISHGEDTIYHAGDTSYTSDMAIIGRLYKVKAACLPIGGHYTMGVEEAIEAVKDIKPRYVIPMHYNTFDVIRVDVKVFEEGVRRETEAEPLILQPGKWVEI